MVFDGPVGSNFQFDHNIVDVGSGWAIFYQEVSNRSYNRYDGAAQITPSGSAYMTGENSGDPMFVSSTDFHLQAGSPATGLGAYAGTTSAGTPPGGTTTRPDPDRHRGCRHPDPSRDDQISGIAATMPSMAGPATTP